MSMDRWMDKTTMGHLHNGILLGHKKENFIETVWMDLENIMLSEIRHLKKDKYDFTHMWNLMNKLN